MILPPGQDRYSLACGRIAGVPIRLHWTLIFFLWPALNQGRSEPVWAVATTLGLILSILAHELGHALSAKAFGVRDGEIMLHGFGGYAKGGRELSPKKELVIILAGPAVTILLTVIFFGLSRAIEQPWLISAIAYSLAWANGIMAVFNLLPILPLDGGQATRAILAQRNDFGYAHRMTCQIGILTAPIALILSIQWNMPLGIVFVITGLITCIAGLFLNGRFELANPRERKRKQREEAAYRERKEAEWVEFQDDVKRREREREEQERLRKLLGE